MVILAPSLRALFIECDARWPHRSHRIDGWYRDPNVGPPSDHHPDARGMVHADDITRDGIDPYALVDACRQHKSVCHYVIYNRKIWSTTYNMVERDYHGPNPHTDHVHVSIHYTAFAENYQGGWGLASGGDQGIGPAPGDPTQGFGAAWDYNQSIATTADFMNWQIRDYIAGAQALANLRT